MKQKTLFAALLCAASSSSLAAGNEAPLEILVVTGTRFEENAADKPLTVSIITRHDIAQSAARTVPELLTQLPGITARDFFGNNAALTTVDLRGFGAAAGQNTLILLDGRRITDADTSGVQWSSIPLASIERIEVIRGSGAVMYGDGATNGVINIITRSPFQQEYDGQLNLRTGSYGMAEVQAAANRSFGDVGIDVTASRMNSRGYRANNQNQQTNAQANVRWAMDAGELALKAGFDHQDIRLPGARLVQPAVGIDQVAIDPRGATTPLDFASRDGNQVAVEWQQKFATMDVNLGVAQRNKNQKSYYDFSGFPNYRDSDLTVTSFTPRARLSHSLGGKSSLVAGLDMHRWNIAFRTSNAVANIGQPINRVSMAQQNNAWYLQNSTSLSAATSLLAGLRSEQVSMSANDIYDATAPGAAFGSGAPSSAFGATKTAYELGMRHRFSGTLALSGKIGHGFRFANVDETWEQSPAFSNQFQFLRPQVSNTAELSLEQHDGALGWRATAFNTRVYDEIHLDAFTTGTGNTNLPPSRRSGLELEGRWQASPALAVNAGFTYTDARFLDGVLPGGAFTQLNVNIAGKHVPLVPTHKLNLAASWAIDERTSLNAAATGASSQFMDNDEANDLGIQIPAYAVADIKLVHKSGPWQWTASVNNLFDRKYFTYAVKSQFTAGRYNAYPLPGRSLFVGLSYRK